MAEGSEGSEGSKGSDIPGFRKMAPAERLSRVREFAGLSEEEAAAIGKVGSLDLEKAGMMIENVIGTHELPLGIATNFLINGKDYLIPMVIEEPSVVAAASNAAKLARSGGGFQTSSDDPIMIGQIQLVNVPDSERAKHDILARKQEFIEKCNEIDPILVKYGGGLKDVEVKTIDTPRGGMIIVHLIVNVSDAMGANVINTMAEKIAPILEEISGAKVRLRIVSNLAVRRLARASAVWPREIVGEEVVEGVLDAYHFAAADPYRCATHNKGVMNGVDAVVIATGNDFRAIEAGAHAYAAFQGHYRPLTKYEKDKDGDLVGTIEIPVAVGLVGGATKTHPGARAAVKILGVKSARELGEVLAAVGLAQNFAALRALSTEGIQKGHLKLHAKNFAVMAGAEGEMVSVVSAKMIAEGKINYNRACDILKELKKD
jgi:hydroxymethylglutaryl-CoA reductase